MTLCYSYQTSLSLIKLESNTRPVGIEPTTSGFGNLRSTD